MVTEMLSLVSVFVAFCAVLVTVWQAQRAARDGERMRSLPIVSEVSREWRSREFRQHRRVVLSLSGTTPSEGGFEALPPDIRESVYTWCFFCDYLGQLVLHKIVSEDLIIGFSGTIISQLWGVLEPFIESERRHRIETLPKGVPPGFLPYYEHLVARVAARGGSTAAEKIREKYSVQKLSSEDLRALIPRVDSSEKRHRTARGWWRHPTALRGDVPPVRPALAPAWCWIAELARMSGPVRCSRERRLHYAPQVSQFLVTDRLVGLDCLNLDGYFSDGPLRAVCYHEHVHELALVVGQHSGLGAVDGTRTDVRVCLAGLVPIGRGGAACRGSLP
jgi:hypothetical protein